jgi:hypothetical protein
MSHTLCDNKAREAKGTKTMGDNPQFKNYN